MARVKGFICDSCGELPYGPHVRLITVTVTGKPHISPSYPTLCSFECLMKWADDMAVQQGRPRMPSDLNRSSFQWLHDKIAQREASGERAYLTVGLCDLKALLAKADAAEGLRRVAEIAGRFHAAYNTDDGVEFHGAEELTLDELNVALGEALDALAKEVPDA